jgi:hypothetical protein
LTLIFGCVLSKVAMTSFSRSSSTFAPTHPFNVTVVTAASPLAFGPSRYVLADEPETKIAETSTTVARATPTVNRLRIYFPLLLVEMRLKERTLGRGACPSALEG